MRNVQGKSDGHGARGSAAGGRLARVTGRMLLWGCVLLLLIRGIVSVLGGAPQSAKTPGPAVTVTQPVTTAPSKTQRR
jgi:hypothetical protein